MRSGMCYNTLSLEKRSRNMAEPGELLEWEVSTWECIVPDSPLLGMFENFHNKTEKSLYTIK